MHTCILVDDEKWVGVDLQKSVHWMDFGFLPPVFFQNPQDALEKICEERPDVVLTDIRMPGMSGIDLITALRRQNIDSEIVILSAYEDFEAAKLALRLQVADYCLKPINVPQIESLLEALSARITLKKQGGRPPAARKADYSEPIQKVVAYLRDNLGRKITLSDAAETIYLNKNYLCGLFHEETGQSFSEFLTQLRIEKAKELLVGTDLPITEIAAQLSYCDNFYFTKVFKKKVGVSPYAYRKGQRGSLEEERS